MNREFREKIEGIELLEDKNRILDQSGGIEIPLETIFLFFSFSFSSFFPQGLKRVWSGKEGRNEGRVIEGQLSRC